MRRFRGIRIDNVFRDIFVAGINSSVTVANVTSEVANNSNTVADISNTFMTVALSDETSAISNTASVVTFRAPFDMELWQIPRASLNVASSSGAVSLDINESGNSIFSTVLTIDESEKTSTTATNPAVLSDTLISNDAEISFDIDNAGTGATGLKVTLYYRKV